MAAARPQNLQQIARRNLSKAERKILKKQNKALHTMKTKAREVGEISLCPTPYLLVKNGGLMCGVKRRDLFSLLYSYGQLEDLVMLSGKSYSYALFQDVKGAENVMTNLNGQKILQSETSLSNKTLYLAYLVKKPSFQMNFLDKSYPNGLILIEDFIEKSEESLLLRYFSNSVDKSEHSLAKASELSVEKQLKHRYVKHYGYEFLYGSNTVDIEKPLVDGMPQHCLPIIEKVTSLECVKHRPDQLTINEYLAGQGIPPHVDTHSAFEDGIICLSLGAKVTMDFRHPDGRHVPVLLPRRSILVMTEESRYVWTHGITPRKYDVVDEEAITCHDGEMPGDTVGQRPMVPSPPGVTLLPRGTRVSLTFRKVRRSACDCKFPSSCDSRSRLGTDGGNSREESMEGDVFVPMTDQDAVDLEKKHVYNVYESIAEHFSGTRHSPWPKIAEFLIAQPLGSLVADVGCGNGKYMGINDQLFVCGSDRSSNLASICRGRGFQVLVCDILRLPYRSNAFDVCICIAVIHHLSTSARRLAALKELTRIVHPGGRILVSVWALEQNLKETNPENTKDVTTDQLLPSKTVNAERSDQGSADSPSSSATAITNTTLANDKTGDNCRSSTMQTTTEHSELVDTGCAANTNATSTPLYSVQQGSHKQKEKSAYSCPSVKLKVNATRNKFEQQDLLVPWHYRGVKTSELSAGSRESTKNETDGSSVNRELVFQRFYHVFKENELVDECRKLKSVSIVRNYYDRGNWCVELEKIVDN